MITLGFVGALALPVIGIAALFIDARRGQIRDRVAARAHRSAVQPVFIWPRRPTGWPTREEDLCR